jgi:hypothetical protein
MVLRLHELGEDFECLFTPTGDELPDLVLHVHRVIERVGKRLIVPENRSLDWWIRQYEALPNWRQRWCTRQIKIVPCITYLKSHPGTTLLVGLRVDEPERTGLYGDWATYRYPLREWGWTIRDVKAFCMAQGVAVPARTDCACCPFQRLGEWYRLWRDYPAEFARSEAYETLTGHTFRSAQRDTWPAGLAGLNAEFERGRIPRGVGALDESACRVCSL